MGSVCILQCGQKAVNIYLSFPSLWNKHLRLCCSSDNVSLLIPLFKGDIYFLLQPYRGPELKYFACLCRPPGNIKHTETDKKLWSLCLKLGAEKWNRVFVWFSQTWYEKNLKSIYLFCIKVSCFSVLIQTSKAKGLLPFYRIMATLRVFLKYISYF